jgi:hypothetical protein
MGLYSAAYAEFDDPSVISGSGGEDPFNTDSTSVGPATFNLQARIGLMPSRYINGDTLLSISSIGGGDKGASVFEFVF